MLTDTQIPARACCAIFGSVAVNHDLPSGRRAFLGYLRRRLGRLDGAEDALQDVRLTAIRAARSVDRDEKITAWIRPILRHTLIDHDRRRAVRHRNEIACAQEPCIAETASAGEAGHGPCRCLHAALSRLRPDHAAILRHADLHAEPRAPIAVDLGLTNNAFNQQPHHARQALWRKPEISHPGCRTDNFLDRPCCEHRNPSISGPAKTAGETNWVWKSKIRHLPKHHASRRCCIKGFTP